METEERAYGASRMNGLMPTEWNDKIGNSPYADRIIEDEIRIAVAREADRTHVNALVLLKAAEQEISSVRRVLDSQDLPRVRSIISKAVGWLAHSQAEKESRLMDYFQAEKDSRLMAADPVDPVDPVAEQIKTVVPEIAAKYHVDPEVILKEMLGPRHWDYDQAKAAFEKGGLPEATRVIEQLVKRAAYHLMPPEMSPSPIPEYEGDFTRRRNSFEDQKIGPWRDDRMVRTWVDEAAPRAASLFGVEEQQVRERLERDLDDKFEWIAVGRQTTAVKNSIERMAIAAARAAAGVSQGDEWLPRGFVPFESHEIEYEAKDSDDRRRPGIAYAI
jgi:hypothetical protein